MKLSKRLQAAAELVLKDSICADIGSDHGYLPIYLVEGGICPRAIAADVNPGPLKSAEKNVQAHGLENKVTLRLGNGLEVLQPNEVDCVTICGMGAGLMSEILDRSPEVVGSLKRLVLAPNVVPEILRLWACQHDWQITAEKLILEDGRFYPLIALEKGKMAELSIAEQFAGPLLLKEKEPLLGDYLRSLRDKEMALAEKLLALGQASIDEKGEYLKKKWRLIEEEYLCRYNLAL